jgi:hypothetical protein
MNSTASSNRLSARKPAVRRYGAGAALAAWCWLCALAPAFAQERLSLGAAVSRSAEYIEGRLPTGTRVLLYPQSPFGELAGYIADGVTERCAHSGKLAILERDGELLRAMERETDYQLSGEVSDETMLSIGKRLGAQYAAFFIISQTGGGYILTVRITAIETGQIAGQTTMILEPEPLAVSLASASKPSGPGRTVNIHDARDIAIAGWEIIETGNGALLNRTVTTSAEFRNAAIDNNLREIRSSLPGLFSGIDQINLDDAVDYVLSNKTMFSAQYVLLFLSGTTIIKSDSRYGLPTRLTASCSFALIDFFSNEIHYSKTVDSGGYFFVLTDLNESTIVNESAKAIKLLFNKNNAQNMYKELHDILSRE